MTRILLSMALVAVVVVIFMALGKWQEPRSPAQRITERLEVKPHRLPGQDATVWDVNEKEMDLSAVPFLNSVPGCKVWQVQGAAVYHVVLPDRASLDGEQYPKSWEESYGGPAGYR